MEEKSLRRASSPTLAKNIYEYSTEDKAEDLT